MQPATTAVRELAPARNNLVEEVGLLIVTTIILLVFNLYTIQPISKAWRLVESHNDNNSVGKSRGDTMKVMSKSRHGSRSSHASTSALTDPFRVALLGQNDRIEFEFPMLVLG